MFSVNFANFYLQGQGGYIFTSFVCLLAGLCTKYLTDFFLQILVERWHTVHRRTRYIMIRITVGENVCNNSKKRKKSCFFGF